MRYYCERIGGIVMGKRMRREYYQDGALRRRTYYNDEGKLHRIDGPAEEFFLKKNIIVRRRWYINGKLHRLDGPAVECFFEEGNGIVECHEWYQDGLLHRLGGPAVEWFDVDGELTSCEWFCNNKLHRLDGPAHESFYGIDGETLSWYWIDGIHMSKKEHRRRVALLKLHTKITADNDAVLL
jgi:hypothetical protein